MDRFGRIFLRCSGCRIHITYSYAMLRFMACFLVFIFIVAFLFYPIMIQPIMIFERFFVNLDKWNYAAVVDAGSSGSRLFLYRFRSRSYRKLISIEPLCDKFGQPLFKKISPGLSSLADDPGRAIDYVKPLLDYAAMFIPKNKQRYTSLFILATAGMRLLNTSVQNAIMNNLHESLSSITALQVMPEHIRVISGDWEGLYSWIAINYVLGRFENGGGTRQSTVGIVDMGGASLQTAFEINESEDGVASYKTINLGCDDKDNSFKFKIFVATFLGYGTSEGLYSYEQYLSEKMLENYSVVPDPCLPLDLSKEVRCRNGNVLIRKGNGNWKQCYERIESLLTKKVQNMKCLQSKCLLNMVPAPSISLSSIELYGFSEYWFTTNDLFSLGGKYNYTALADKSEQFCAQKWSDFQKQWRNELYLNVTVERIEEQCFKSAWIGVILHNGLLVDKTNHNFKSVFDVDGQEVQWTLGALLYHLRYFPLGGPSIQRFLKEPVSKSIEDVHIQ